MKLFDVLKSVGAAAINTFLPGMGGPIVNVVNEFIGGDDEKLDPETATGKQVEEAVAKLPPDQQAKIMGMRVDLEAKRLAFADAEDERWHELQERMLTSEEKGVSTRPFVVKALTFLVLLGIGSLLLSWAFSMVIAAWACMNAFDGATSALDITAATAKCSAASMVAPGYEQILALLALPTWVIQTYFGKRTKEKEMRMNNTNGHEVDADGFLTKVGKKLLGKR